MLRYFPDRKIEPKIRFLESYEEEMIDFICFDANEPEIDEGDVFFNTYFFQFQNKDKGARTLFETLDRNGLKDALVSQETIEKNTTNFTYN